MKLSGIMPSSLVILITLGNVGGRDGQLSVDLVERGLGVGKAELVLEKRGFGWIAIGAGQIEPLGRVNKLLGLLHDAREVGEHNFGQRRMTRGNQVVGGFVERWKGRSWLQAR